MNAPAQRPTETTAIARPLVRIVIVGHVDHGKSTLIGRLLAETGSLPDGKLENLKAVSARRGMAFEWSFLLDALQTERDQGITIDTSQIRFRTPSRDIVLIDAPGHTEFLRNMITGASQADAALLLIDAAEGVREQTRRHGYLLHLLGVRQVAVVINKMDRVDYDASRFDAIDAEITAHLRSLGIEPMAVIPISARHGDGVTARGAATSWYAGPTVLDALDGFSPAHAPDALALRLPVQAVYKFDDRRIIAGRIESGRIAVGDEIAVSPAGTVAKIRSIETWPELADGHRPAELGAGYSAGITLDRELFVTRGDVLTHRNTPAKATRRLTARVFWLHHEALIAGAAVTVRIATAEARGTVAAIDNAVDPGELAAIAPDAIGQNNIGDIIIDLARPLAADPYTDNPRTGRLVLERDGRIVGGGLVLALDGQPDRAEQAPALGVRAEALAASLKHLTLRERLAQFRNAVAGRFVFTTSFGIEDQAILHDICEQNLDIDIATLDTGRLFPETYTVWEETERRYGRRIQAVYPRNSALSDLVRRHGINGFYQSRESRLACCDVRKVEPLGRILAGASAWITGLRADQSALRQTGGLVTADLQHGLLKFSPLFDRTRDQVKAFVDDSGIPVNALHAKGFISIGCAPCTRAVQPGEPERAGRWWWEDETKKECGLHPGRGR